jgi:putative endonuclease
MKQPAVYIMANKRNGTLYTGVSSDLIKRVYQHRMGYADGFTKRYGCKLLVWYYVGGDMEHAILREKQIKAGSRAKKLALIEGINPEWRDLWPDIAHP